MALGVWWYRYPNTRYTVSFPPAMSGENAFNAAARHLFKMYFISLGMRPYVGTCNFICIVQC